MNVNTDTYALGEEVVVRLARARVFDGRIGAVVERKHVPAWTIGRIVYRHESGPHIRYVLSFRYRKAPYLCSVDAKAIDGVA